MNCLALEQDDGILIIDCGIGFPSDDHGVEILHPDFEYLLQRRNRVCGVFLTHGHEDHVGALPYLLSALNVPVWGPAHALKLGQRRVRECANALGTPPVDWRTVVPGQRYRVGPFQVEPVRVSHSIIEATALSIETCAGVIVHSGDFKFDGHPPDGVPTDSARLKELGDRGIALLLSDSTNIDSPSDSGSERRVAEALGELVDSAPRRVVVGMFSSNVQRLISLGQIARRSGRRIGLLGRSLSTHVEIAHDLGHLAWPEEQRVPSDQLSQVPPRELLLLAGGTQGEPASALARLSRAEHAAMTLDAGDRVLLSSRVIPGNERRVSQLTSQLLRLDVDLHARVNAPDIHVSGHAARPELTRMIELLRPAAFIPVHGTLHHLRRHAELAQELGVSRCVVIENGQQAELSAGQLCAGDYFPSGRIAVDRSHRALSSEVLQTRTEIGRTGLVHVCVVLDENGSVCTPPRLSVMGVPGLESPASQQDLALQAERTLRKQSQLWRKRGLAPEQELERALGFHLERRLGVRPCTRVQVVNV
jgi:ribonuclease J